MMKLGIIGGSGLYDIEGLKDAKEIKVSTPFGDPSDALVEGELCGTRICFLPRHGKGHRILPGELNHKANIFALKTLGVTGIISISAVGSLREDYAPRDVVVVDQYFDRTKSGLSHTFFGNGIVAHVSLASPVCPCLSKLAKESAEASVCELEGERPKVHFGGCYLNMEGPAFSTKAESKVYRSWGMDVIGMTNLGEARLAREAGICYSTVAMVTDYDCWHPAHDSVTVDMIIGNFNANVGLAKRIIRHAAEGCATGRLSPACHCADALAGAIITAPDCIPAHLKAALSPIIGKYVS